MKRLRPLRTNEDAARARRELGRLWDAKPGTPARDRFEVLAALVYAYERQPETELVRLADAIPAAFAKVPGLLALRVSFKPCSAHIEVIVDDHDRERTVATIDACDALQDLFLDTQITAMNRTSQGHDVERLFPGCKRVLSTEEAEALLAKGRELQDALAPRVTLMMGFAERKRGE